MGFAQHTHDNMDRGNVVSNTTFFDFRVRSDDKSPEMYFDIAEPGQAPENAYGHYEIVWFLNSISYSPVYKYHETSGQDQILCAATFPESGGRCPACDEFERLKAQYGGGKVDKDIYKKFAVKGQRQKLIIPVYVPRRAKERHIYKGKAEVMPIYWFHLNADGYPPEAQASYLRLRKADETTPISQYPFMVFRKSSAQGERAEYWFRAVNYDANTMGIFTQHPLLLPPYLNNQNPSQKGWGQDYYDLMEVLPILQFSRFVDPATGQPSDYFGYYTNAMNAYNYVKQVWPAPYRRLEAHEIPQPQGPQFAFAGGQPGMQQQQPTQQYQQQYSAPQQPAYQQQFGQQHPTQTWGGGPVPF